MLGHFVSLTNTSRVLDDLHVLHGFGATGGGLHGFGVSRPALSDVDIESRRWLMNRMESAGLNGVQMDGLGTLYGSAGIEALPAVLMGSHTDVMRPQGDWMDGALGFSYALEAARVLRQGGASDFAAWSVVDWSDEEGRFGTLNASSAFASGGNSCSEHWPSACQRYKNAASVMITPCSPACTSEDPPSSTIVEGSGAKLPATMGRHQIVPGTSSETVKLSI
jgi:N-carbamoyl-L-amino-acid hydrolase